MARTAWTGWKPDDPVGSVSLVPSGLRSHECQQVDLLRSRPNPCPSRRRRIRAIRIQHLRQVGKALRSRPLHNLPEHPLFCDFCAFCGHPAPIHILRLNPAPSAPTAIILRRYPRPFAVNLSSAPCSVPPCLGGEIFVRPIPCPHNPCPSCPAEASAKADPCNPWSKNSASLTLGRDGSAQPSTPLTAGRVDHSQNFIDGLDLSRTHPEDT